MKSIKISETTYNALSQIKLETSSKSINEVVEYLVQNYKDTSTLENSVLIQAVLSSSIKNIIIPEVQRLESKINKNNLNTMLLYNLFGITFEISDEEFQKAKNQTLNLIEGIDE